MDDDDLPQPRAENPLQSKNLVPLSVTELEAYIGALKAEIARAEEAIKAKQGHRTGAEAFFRK